MILAATSIVALVVLKMHVYRQILLILGRPFLNTMKSTGMKQEMVETPESSILLGRLSRIATLYGSRCVSLMSLGEAFPRFSSSYLDLGSASTSASAFSSSSTGLVLLSNILERRFTSVEVLPHTTLLAIVEREIGFATQQWSLN
jgi:hypothetical protein